MIRPVTSSWRLLTHHGRITLYRTTYRGNSQFPPSPSLMIRDEKPKVVKEPSTSPSAHRMEKVSQAMKSYLERADKHDQMLKEKEAEYELGKRHLANMMGWDPSAPVTQDQIDDAIKYLLPSGLFNVKARPMMKEPKDLLPKRKSPQFNVQGRPFHYLFYTARPNYYQMLHDIHGSYNKLNDLEDMMILKGIMRPPPEAAINLGGSEWISYKEFKAKLLEPVSEEDYRYAITSLTRLSTHPYSGRVQELFMDYRKEMVSVTSTMAVEPLQLEPDTRREFARTIGLKRHCEAHVVVKGAGSGVININGEDLSYFPDFKEREQVLFPLQFCGLLEQVDIEANVTGCGVSSQAGAVRHGISLALRSFVSPAMMEQMRLAGLLTKDRRVAERKKPGQWAARRKFTWKKR